MRPQSGPPGFGMRYLYLWRTNTCKRSGEHGLSTSCVEFLPRAHHLTAPVAAPRESRADLPARVTKAISKKI
jgi:hypothetical protein